MSRTAECEDVCVFIPSRILSYTRPSHRENQYHTSLLEIYINILKNANNTLSLKRRIILHPKSVFWQKIRLERNA